MLSANTSFNTVSMDDSATPMEMVQKYYKEQGLQRMTDTEAIEFLKTCKE